MPIPETHIEGLRALGWVDGDRVLVPVLTRSESRGLSDVADLVTADLAEALKRSLPTIRRAYDDSPYASEVSFEEHYMWWYHLFYTAVTDRLISTREIVVPRFGIATYVVTDEPPAK